MPHADLRRTEHEKGTGKARRGIPINVEMRDGELARPQLDRGQVFDIDGAVAGEAWAHEQCDVVAPRDKRLLEEFQPLAALRHEGCEGVRLVGAERSQRSMSTPPIRNAVFMQ